ncbi:DUF485 domain-containing protein [Pseudarthrobacter sp. J75]|uniref:DUF485 domain-containing protein n=1 Tax=unclassified Pseudarthrobacter TaxID=2647000 RepID=UPI002E80501E|nr:MULTISPECIES: DUF485 domain-containing protein [unclassified Pseudarthrobacter]MEE2521770.1 DUF485 domain-containing protein [Pseudarthrobacter sp. J47]MEE2527847.1 DUF485 domain-containing protein [Pseudarthrobacter sp. J75]
MGNDAPTPDAAASVDFVQVQSAEQFQELRKRHRSFVFPMALAFLLWYFAYVLLADYAVDFMSTKVWGNINIGLLLGLLQFVSTFAITGWYVSYSNRRLDPIATEIRQEIEGHQFDKDGAAVSGVKK